MIPAYTPFFVEADHFRPPPANEESFLHVNLARMSSLPNLDSVILRAANSRHSIIPGERKESQSARIVAMLSSENLLKSSTLM